MNKWEPITKQMTVFNAVGWAGIILIVIGLINPESEALSGGLFVWLILAIYSVFFPPK